MGALSKRYTFLFIERPSLTTRTPATTSTTTTKITTMTTIQDWKKSDMYGSHLNEFEHDFQSNRKNKNRKKQQEEYNRYETTSSKLSQSPEI